MLVEVIIVTVVVATIMTSLYVAFNKVYTAYDEKSSYSNIDGIYALKLIKDNMINDLTINTKLNETTSYSKIDYAEGSYLDSVFSEYKINSVYLIKVSDENVSSFKNDFSINQTFKDYLDYLVNKQIALDNNLLLVEITIDYENKIYNYAYLEV